MAYLGNPPVVGAFKKLDPLTFNGVTTTFTAAVSSAPVLIGTPQNLILSISGVIQEPGVAFTIAGSQINFTEAPLSTDSFFGILLGSVGEIWTVTDGSVNNSKLSNLSVASYNLMDSAVISSKIAPGAAVTNIGYTPYNATNPSGYITASANTYSGTQTGADNILTGFMIKDAGAVFVDKGPLGSGTATFNYSSGSVQRLTVTGAISIDFSNFPPTGNMGSMMLELVNAGSYSVTFPGTINWIKSDGTLTTSISTYLTNIERVALQTSGVDFIVVWTRDAGNVIYGKIL